MPFSLKGQAPDTLWTRTYGGNGSDGGYSVIQTKDGGFILAGGSNSFGDGSHDLWLIKTNVKGDTIWTRVYGGNNLDVGTAVEQTADGGYIIVGYTQSYGVIGTDIWLLKTSATGELLWMRTYGGSGSEWGQDVQQTTDKGYLLAGNTSSFGAKYYDAILIKTDSIGQAIWTRTYGGTGWEGSQSLKQTRDGNYILGGTTDSYGAGGKDIWLVKINPEGDEIWSRTFGGNDDEWCRAVEETYDGGFIAAGYTNSFGAGGFDFLLIKADSIGQLQWMQTYGGSGKEICLSARQTRDEGYILAGETSSFGSGSVDFWIVKTDSDGDTLWTDALGGESADYGKSVDITYDEGFIITGTTSSYGAGLADLWLVRVLGIPLKVITTNPSQNSLNVPNNTSIEITFNYPLDSSTIGDTTLLVHGTQSGWLEGNIGYQSQTNTVSFEPNNQFQGGERVTVILTKKIESQLGDVPFFGFGWEFNVSTKPSASILDLADMPSRNRGSYSIIVGDWDADKDIDLAVVSSGEDKIVFLSDDGAGSYSESASLDVSRPNVISAADLDHDHDLDLLVGKGDGQIFIYMNDGTGSFVQTSSLSTGGEAQHNLHIQDINNDGSLDLIATTHGNFVPIFLNDGEGNLVHKATLTFSGAYMTGSVSTGDFDGDGDFDLAIGHWLTNGTGSLSIFFNDGSGTFTLDSVLGLDSYPYNSTTGDFDNDGDLDIIIANKISDSISILRNDGTGNFIVTTAPGMGQPEKILAGDYDGDGYLDLAVTDTDSDYIRFLYNDGSGNFDNVYNREICCNPNSIATADFDFDGDLDFAAANSYILGDNVFVYHNMDILFARALVDTEIEQSDTVGIHYLISSPRNWEVSLISEFSTDSGNTWLPASVLGDTANLTNDFYEGMLFWNSYLDLPGVDVERVSVKITPYDNYELGRAIESPAFHLDNNHEPKIIITPITNELSDDVEISYFLEDDEVDTLNLECYYSIDSGQTWHLPYFSGTVSNILEDEYSGRIVWESARDLPGMDIPEVFFRIIPSDYEKGTADEVIFHLDNNEIPRININPISSDTVISSTDISYLLSDVENDTLSIVAYYSFNQEQSWLKSVVSNGTHRITPSDYSGSLTWLAFGSLHGHYENISLLLVPSDNDPGIPDTLLGLTVINYPADYSGDLRIGTDDLVEFAAAWNAEPQNLAYEIGPATGTAPDLLPQPDGVLDFEDLMVFIQMWNWSFEHHGFAKTVPVLAKARAEASSLELMQRMPEDPWNHNGRIRVEVHVKNTGLLMMVEGLLVLDRFNMQAVEITSGGYLEQLYQSAPLFQHLNTDSTVALFATVGLGRKEKAGSEDLPVITMTFRQESPKEQQLVLDYTLWSLDGDIVETGQLVQIVEPLIPKAFALHQNYPNPFNPTTTIRFELPKASEVYLVIYDILGREVAGLVDGYMEAGYRQVIWNGKDGYGRDISSGIYIVRILTPEYTRSIKTVLLK